MFGKRCFTKRRLARRLDEVQKRLESYWITKGGLGECVASMHHVVAATINQIVNQILTIRDRSKRSDSKTEENWSSQAESY